MDFTRSATNQIVKLAHQLSITLPDDVQDAATTGHHADEQYKALTAPPVAEVVLSEISAGRDPLASAEVMRSIVAERLRDGGVSERLRTLSSERTATAIRTHAPRIRADIAAAFGVAADTITDAWNALGTLDAEQVVRRGGDAAARHLEATQAEQAMRQLLDLRRALDRLTHTTNGGVLDWTNPTLEQYTGPHPKTFRDALEAGWELDMPTDTQARRHELDIAHTNAIEELRNNARRRSEYHNTPVRTP